MNALTTTRRSIEDVVEDLGDLEDVPAALVEPAELRELAERLAHEARALRLLAEELEEA